MANIFKRLGSSILERGIGGTIGHGFGKLGMGALKGAGTVALGGAELTGRAAMGASGGIGRSILGTAAAHPGLVAGAVLTTSAFSGIAADQDGQVDPGRAMLKGAAGGLLLSAVPGAAGLTAGAGVAALGAGVMGAGALGTVGKSMIKMPKGQMGLGDLGELELNKKFAVPLILGASAIKGIADGVSTFEKGRMGQNDGMYRGPSPQLPRPDQTAVTSIGNPTTLSNRYYANNAGATGDLVFAMHKNR